jgi:sugar/nucleoside kinase (ribokinase family)
MEKIKDKKAVVAGHLCLDMTPSFHNEPIERIDQLFGPGLVVDVGKAYFNPGGCVSNTGLAMNFFGADVTFMGRISDDFFGNSLVETYEKSGAKLALKFDKDHPTGYTLVISPKGIDRMFLHNAGTNEFTNNEDFDKDIINQADLFHFGYPTLMAQYQKDSCKELIDLYKLVKEKDTVTSLDLTMPDHSSDVKDYDWDEIFSKLLPNVDVFAPSFEEIQYILDPKKYQKIVDKAEGGDIAEFIDFKNDVLPIAEKLLAYGCAIVLIKCGPRGMFLKTADSKRLEKVAQVLDLDLEKRSNFEYIQPSFVADRLVAATGAGDTSIAAFLTSLLRGEDPRASLEYAAGAGASCVTEVDPISGLLSFDQMREKIDKGRKRND